MGLLGFISKLVGTAAKAAIVTPIAIVEDVIGMDGMENTIEALIEAHDDAENAFEELTED